MSYRFNPEGHPYSEYSKYADDKYNRFACTNYSLCRANYNGGKKEGKLEPLPLAANLGCSCTGVSQSWSCSLFAEPQPGIGGNKYCNGVGGQSLPLLERYIFDDIDEILPSNTPHRDKSKYTINDLNAAGVVSSDLSGLALADQINDLYDKLQYEMNQRKMNKNLGTDYGIYKVKKSYIDSNGHAQGDIAYSEIIEKLADVCRICTQYGKDHCDGTATSSDLQINYDNPVTHAPDYEGKYIMRARNQFNTLLSIFLPAANDCLCYSQCGEYRKCVCFGNCQYY